MMRPKLFWRVAGTFFFLSVAARADSPDENYPRVSSAPKDFLSQGFGNAPWVRDPFFPSVAPFRLSGVITNEMAFINGNWVRIGESIGRWKLQAVGSDEVVLHQDGKSLQLRLSEQEKSK